MKYLLQNTQQKSRDGPETEYFVRNFGIESRISCALLAGPRAASTERGAPGGPRVLGNQAAVTGWSQEIIDCLLRSNQ
jgi:hypothetical protein